MIFREKHVTGSSSFVSLKNDSSHMLSIQSGLHQVIFATSNEQILLGVHRLEFSGQS